MSLLQRPIVIKQAPLWTALFVVAFVTATHAGEPKWHEVKPSEFKVELTLSGVFEALNTHEVKVETEQWAILKVVEGVEQGRHVSKGDVLVRFETEDIDKKIEATRKARESAAIALADAEADLKVAEVTVPLSLEEAERAFVRAKEVHERWTEYNREQYVTKIENTLQSAKFALAYQQAELDQLRKMYAEDSITEESEEIVLERQERSVKLAKDALADAETDYDYNVKVNLPMTDAKVTADWATAQAVWKKTQQTLPRSLEAKRLAIAKMRKDREESNEKFAELVADRGKLVVKSPATGVVYYGTVNRGKWSNAESVNASMKPDGIIKPKAGFITIVEPRPLRLSTGVTEVQFRKAVVGSPARIVPAVDSNLRFSGKLESVAPLPLGTTWDTIISVDVPDSAAHVVAGMTGKATVTAFHAKDALTVPASAVEREDDGSPFVHVKGNDGKPAKRTVTLGWSDGKRVQITKGLSAGDHVKAGVVKPAAPKAPAKSAEGKK